LIVALDSNAIIHAMKGMGRVGGRLAQMSPADVTIPAVVVYELEFGTLRSAHPAPRKKDLDRLIGVLSILPFDNRAAGFAARIRFELEQSGASIGPIDLLIAGTVMAHGAKLITHNTKEFARVPGLAVEDWF
jgi:tRNA(fMet)-specific endonuclease VapC